MIQKQEEKTLYITSSACQEIIDISLFFLTPIYVESHGSYESVCSASSVANFWASEAAGPDREAFCGENAEKSHICIIKSKKVLSVLHLLDPLRVLSML